MGIEEISELTFKRIELLCKQRLKGSVSTYEVLVWLSNFKLNEYDKALSILEYLDVYSENDLIDLWEERLKACFKTIHANSSIIIHPISDFGKSGTLMLYYIRKTTSYANNKHRITFYENYSQIKYKNRGKRIPANSHFILVDDFIGSGKTLRNYYKGFIGPQLIKISEIVDCHALVLFSLTKALRLLNSQIPEVKIISDIKISSFASRGSVFGHGKNMYSIRNFAYKYGIGLFATYDERKKVSLDHPLGFENSQALIVFPYGAPNNTLPIIWSSANGRKPLYPRASALRISDAKKIRKELAHYMAMIRHSDLVLDFQSGRREISFTNKEKQLEWRTVHFVTKTDFQAFACLFLRRQRRAVPTICQILGITQTDYQNQIDKLKKASVINNEGDLTEFGERIYFEVLTQLQKNRKMMLHDRKDPLFENNMYLPKQFKGWSQF